MSQKCPFNTHIHSGNTSLIKKITNGLTHLETISRLTQMSPKPWQQVSGSWLGKWDRKPLAGLGVQCFHARACGLCGMGSGLQGWMCYGSSDMESAGLITTLVLPKSVKGLSPSQTAIQTLTSILVESRWQFSFPIQPIDHIFAEHLPRMCQASFQSHRSEQEGEVTQEATHL